MLNNFLLKASPKSTPNIVKMTKKTKSSHIRWMLLITTFFLFSINHATYASMAEQTAVQDLVPISSASRQVVSSGSWSSPATWNDGIIPAAGENIYVPKDKSLTVDVVSDVAHGTIRADGTLMFPTNKNVKIKLDTLVVTESGKFIVGSETSRVQSSKKIEIIIANKGPIDRTWDPFNVSRGVIIQGTAKIFGADKSAFHALATYPEKGTTTLTLDTVPTGWEKGDIIAVTATKFRRKKNYDTRYITGDELRKIKAISGNVITLGQVDDSSLSDPLTYSHIPTIPNMPVYVANLTRNVVFMGEGGESVPASQRGHFMVMHTPDVVIKGAGFYYLGRTDKSKPIDDFMLKDNGYRETDKKGNFIPGANNNPRGRYAVHFHHTGVNNNSAPIICSGNAVFSSPGWGFVNHTSHVVMENNASYNVYGSHFVSEDGNERGAFRHNIAIKSQGRESYSKFGQGNHDVGHTGHGFWLESRNLIMEDNVVSGVNKAGVVYFHRNNAPGVNLMIPRDNLLTPDKDIVKNLPSIYYEKVPITHEVNTTVLSSGSGLVVIKSFPLQDHDARNTIESFRAYSVIGGLGIQYTENYTLRNIEIVADSDTAKWDEGFNMYRRVKKVVLDNVKIDGFIHPIITGTTFAGQPDQTDVIFKNVMVNGRAIIPQIDIHQPGLITKSNYDPKFHKIINTNIDSSNIAASLPKDDQGVLKFTPAKDLSANFPSSYNKGFIVRGTKSDSLGEIAFESKWLDKQLLATVHKGYYTDAQKNKYVFLKDIMSDRLTGQTIAIKTKLKLLVKFMGLGPNLGPLPQ